MIESLLYVLGSCLIVCWHHKGQRDFYEIGTHRLKHSKMGGSVKHKMNLIIYCCFIQNTNKIITVSMLLVGLDSVINKPVLTLTPWMSPKCDGQTRHGRRDDWYMGGNCRNKLLETTRVTILGLCIIMWVDRCSVIERHARRLFPEVVNLFISQRVRVHHYMQM